MSASNKQLQAEIERLQSQMQRARAAKNALWAEGIECLGPARCSRDGPCAICQLEAALSSPVKGGGR